VVIRCTTFPTALFVYTSHTHTDWKVRGSNQNPSGPALGPTQPPLQMVTSYLQGKAARAWRWPHSAIHKNSTAIFLLTLWAFMECYGVNFTFTLLGVLFDHMLCLYYWVIHLFSYYWSRTYSCTFIAYFSPYYLITYLWLYYLITYFCCINWIIYLWLYDLSHISGCITFRLLLFALLDNTLLVTSYHAISGHSIWTHRLPLYALFDRILWLYYLITHFRLYCFITHVCLYYLITHRWLYHWTHGLVVLLIT
jgi:hypothetical protein